MTVFCKFEEIQAWQKARKVTQCIYQVTSSGEFQKDYGLRDQIRRASVSIMANIAEGYGRQSEREFTHFLNIARGSAMEVKSHLYVALDLNFLSTDAFDALYSQLDEILRMIFGLMKALKKQ